MILRTRVRTAAVAASAALLGLLGAGPAAAGPTPGPDPVQSTAPAPVSALAAQDRVEEFLTAYLRARMSTTEDATPDEVRKSFLTPELDRALRSWSAAHPAQDPVFRAPNAPSSWTLKAAGPDTSNVVVTQRWGDGTTAEVLYTVRPGDLLITAIADRAATG